MKNSSIVRFFWMVVFFLSWPVQSQIVSQFSFESDPVTAADIGPDATAISASAYSGPGGAGGTRGLNAGLPKANINMVIPGSPTFDLNGIDVSFDYQREENGGTFWQRGSSLSINGCNNLSVSYRVDDGGGGFVTVNSGNVYAIPNDDTYRNYRFYYTPCDGYGALLVDGVEVWSNDGPDNRNMYWTGAGDVTVGGGIDGTGNDDTFMDNVIVGEIICSPLPIELVSFTATYNESNRIVDLEWITASENNNDYFTVERSADGVNWEKVLEKKGAGNSSQTLTYSEIDRNPFIGVSYYRLKQTDFNGKYEYSPIVQVNRKVDKITVYPNPVKKAEEMVIYVENNFSPQEDEMVLYSADGKIMRTFNLKEIVTEQKSLIISTDDLNAGLYILRYNQECVRIIVK
ncbi:MAG: T9SS type A sorting domain-containing protein [Crocinitomicaceae bacterium]